MNSSEPPEAERGDPSLSSGRRPPASERSDITGRHACHCGRTFIRREHLKRHRATHGERSFVCSVCQRSFTRNDLLRRHAAAHNEPPVLPRPRLTRACDGCHDSKTKCDGEAPCSLCTKKGIRCTYKAPPKDSNPAGTTGSTHQQVRPRSGATTPTARPPERAPNDSQSPDFINHLIANALARLTDMVKSRALSLTDEYKILPEDEGWVNLVVDEYCERFHKAWPVVHMPTFFNMTPAFGVAATVIMIGAWLLKGASVENVEEKCLEQHEKLIDLCFEQLSSQGGQNTAEEPWPTEIYQTAILNIVFAFYHGSERAVSRASLLRGLLIEALRDAGYFQSAQADVQQKTHRPGTFFPWVHGIQEGWKRTIIALYKIDAYLSIARWHPPALRREELDVGLPLSFALWNAYGLHVFFERLRRQPAERLDWKLCDVLGSDDTDADVPGPPPLFFLLEDVQLALCGLSDAIWRCKQPRRHPGHESPPSDTLGLRLEVWRTAAERMFQQGMRDCSDEGTPIAESPLLRFYLGRFDDDPARGRLDAEAHVKALTSDALLLYHAQAMRLHADTRAMNAIARQQHRRDASLLPPESSIAVTTSPTPPPDQDRLRQWASSPGGRRAVANALQVLKLCEAAARQEYRRSREAVSGRTGRGHAADPLARLAASVGALVLWAWLAYAGAASACNSCLPGAGGRGAEIRADGGDAARLEAADLERWVQAGGAVAVEGSGLCRCAAEGWMTRFAAVAVEEGFQRSWALGNGIAPMLSSLRSAGKVT